MVASVILDCLGMGPSRREPADTPRSVGAPPSSLPWPLGLLSRRSGKPQSSSQSEALLQAEKPSPSCIFCNVTSEKGFNIVLEDDAFVAFHDRSPAARLHLLVVPRKHIPNVQSLEPSPEQTDAKMVEAMHSFGSRALDLALKQLLEEEGEREAARENRSESLMARLKRKAGYGTFTDKGILQPDSCDWRARYADEDPGPRRYGFHIPPFRSVDHLHLHCLLLPFVSSIKALKYRVALPDEIQPPAPAPAPPAIASEPHPRHKGWSWFAQWKQTVDILRSGKKVEVKAC